MALWGNKDSKSASGTITSIDSEGNVVGSGTAFTTEAKIGNTIYADNKQFLIVTIEDDTHCTVRSGVNGGEIEVGSSYSYTLSEKPAYVAASESADTSGDSGDSSKVFGVDVSEIWVGPGSITDIAIVQGGSNYTETPNVTIEAGDGGQAVAEATLTNGVVTAITVTDNGNYSYQNVPNVYIDVPRRTVLQSAVDTETDIITYTTHGLNTGDAVIYRANGLGLGGLGDGDTYYVISTNANAFQLASSAEDADDAIAIDLSSTGNDNQYFDLVAPAGVTATAVAVKGSGTENQDSSFAAYTSGEQHVTHAGWVRKTVGTGGRAGRVQYETLVAMGSIQGDQNDDIQFPDD